MEEIEFIEKLNRYVELLANNAKSLFIKNFDGTEPKLSLIVKACHRGADDNIEDRRKQENPVIACKKKCSHCCRFRVAISTAEAISIAYYIKETFLPKELDRLKTVLNTLATETAKMNTVEWTMSGLTCPFLVNEECFIYPVRPLSCRGWNSTDVNLCEYSLVNEAVFHELPKHQWEMQQLISVVILDAINEGINEVGLDGNRVELITALKILICDEDAVKKWLAGEDIFNEAMLPLVNDYKKGVKAPPLYQVSRKRRERREGEEG